MVGRDGGGGQSIRFGLEAWAAWLPGGDALAVGGTAAAPAAVPALLRRRVTAIGRKVLEAAWAAGAGLEVHPRIILSSRHGEYERTFGLLRTLAQSGEVSPAEFSLCVHHGLAGLFSIATGNRAGHTALSAGAESLGYACMEAACCLAEGDDRVLLLHFDEPLPECYGPVTEDDDAAPVAMALLLTPAGGQGVPTVSMSFSPGPDGGSDPLDHAFARLLAGEAAQVRARGPRMEWRWSLVP